MFYVQPSVCVVRSPKMDSLAYWCSVDNRERAVLSAIVSKPDLCIALQRHGFNVYEHKFDSPERFILHLYLKLIEINNKTHVCNKETILVCMRNLEWLREFLIKSATEVRVSSVAAAKLV